MVTAQCCGRTSGSLNPRLRAYYLFIYLLKCTPVRAEALMAPKPLPQYYCRVPCATCASTDTSQGQSSMMALHVVCLVYSTA